MTLWHFKTTKTWSGELDAQLFFQPVFGFTEHDNGFVSRGYFSLMLNSDAGKSQRQKGRKARKIRKENRQGDGKTQGIASLDAFRATRWP